MSSSLPTETPAAAFVCDCNMLSRSACDGMSLYGTHKGKQYCVLHYPGKEKKDAFDEALKRKLAAEDFDFREVWFPDFVVLLKFEFTKPVNFYSATFSEAVDFSCATFDAEANFSQAHFAATATFVSTTFKSKAAFIDSIFVKTAGFYKATFEADAAFYGARFGPLAIFESATFQRGAGFDAAIFGKDVNFRAAIFDTAASFHSAIFTNVNFSDAIFSREVSFHSTTFKDRADFRFTNFKDYVRFVGEKNIPVFSNESSLDLQVARIEKPDRFSFHTLTLRPHWFVNVDARKFEFINVNWENVHWDWRWRNTSLKQEIESLQANNVSPAYRLLSVACRNLAVNAEENHRYQEASRLRYLAMNVRRLEMWRGFAPWTLGWWYWLASGYGERVWRAFVVLIGVWLLAAALYTRVGFVRWEPRVSSEQEAAAAKRDEVGQPLRGWRPLTYSLGVMTLQKPEPRPATDAAQAVVMLETILGPVQAALLALAIRRKFMR